MDLLIDCYLATSRVTLLADRSDPSTWQEMHTLLPNLHEHLSCRVCRKLVDQLNRPYTDGFACTACAEDLQMAAHYTPLSTIVQCYKKLCAYIEKTPWYVVMCSRHEDNRLVELVTEVISASRRPVNGLNGLANGTTVSRQQEEEDVEEADGGHGNVKSYTQCANDESSDEDVSWYKLYYMSPEKLKVESHNLRPQNQSVHSFHPRRKKNERGCRCGNTTSAQNKLTCFGQRCPCYTEQKPCDQCKCRGCKNPRQKRSDNDDNLKIDKRRRKPVTLELVSSLKPSHIKSHTAFSSYTIHDAMQFPSHSRNYDQGGAEVTLGHVNSIFHSP